jgi:hypothetical protein
LLTACGRVPYAEPPVPVLLWDCIKFPTIKPPNFPTATAPIPIPNSTLSPLESRPIRCANGHQTIDQLRRVKNSIGRINGILAIGGGRVVDGEAVGLKHLKGAFWFGAQTGISTHRRKGPMRRIPPTIPLDPTVDSLRRKSW